MTDAPEKMKGEQNRLKQGLSRHRMAAFALVILAPTLALLIGCSLFRGPGEKPPAPHGSVNAPNLQVQNGADDALNPQAQIGVSWIKPAGTEAAYAGNEACRTCHPGEFESHAASPHAHTLHAIPPGVERPEFGSNQVVTDDLNGVVYTVRKGKAKNQLLATTASSTQDAAARWAFGSGDQAWTYLAQNGPKFLQMRITYYPETKTWNFTPGSGPRSFHIPLGDPYSSVEAAACFGCHSTVLIGSRENLDLAHSRLNVGCESCHGPCRSHIDSVTSARPAAGAAGATQAKILKPPLHTGPQIMDLCGQCHRIPVAVTGDVSMPETQIARFPGIALPRSRCFIESAGKLSCTTCHNPHQSTSRQRLTSFEQACTNCHSAPHGKPCTRGKTSGCVNCHMPRERLTPMLPLQFHNHWIRKFPAADSQ